MAKRAKLSPYRIGMFGAGTVGGGVYELVMNRRPRRSGAVISKICVRDAGKSRDFAIDGERTAVVTDPASILEDADIDCVVEVMGGTGLARTVVLDALRAGKSVVTANKALVAEHMAELEELCAAKDGEGEVPAPFLAYEAAVCGGIPS
jgi:homoserine dehydrogenase